MTKRKPWDKGGKTRQQQGYGRQHELIRAGGVGKSWLVRGGRLGVHRENNAIKDARIC